MCINAAQDELHFVYTCIQQSCQHYLKECNDAETSTNYVFLWDFYIVRLDSSSCIYTKTDDLSGG